MVTPVIQEGTALNKATLEAMKFETVAPIFLSEGGDFGYYGVKAGATINKGDYVVTEEVQTNIGVPNQVYFKGGAWATTSLNYRVTSAAVENLKFNINGETYFVVARQGRTANDAGATLSLYKYNGDRIEKTWSAIQILDTTYQLRMAKISSVDNMFVLVVGRYSSSSSQYAYIYIFKIENNSLTQVAKQQFTNNKSKELYNLLEISQNKFLISLEQYGTTGYYRQNVFFEITGSGLSTISILSDTADATSTPSFSPRYITKLQDGTFTAHNNYNNSCCIVQIDTTNYTLTKGKEINFNGISLFENMRNLDVQNNTYYIWEKENTGRILLRKWVLKPSENIYTQISGYVVLPNTSGVNAPLHIIGEIGDNLIISEGGNNIDLGYTVSSVSPSKLLHLIIIKKDFTQANIQTKVNTDLAYTIYPGNEQTFWNGHVYWTIMIAENSATIWAYYGYDSDTGTSYYHEIPLKPYERQIRPIANVNEKIFGIANAQIGAYDTPVRPIEMIVEKKYNTT